MSSTPTIVIRLSDAEAMLPRLKKYLTIPAFYKECETNKSQCLRFADAVVELEFAINKVKAIQ